jgi:hypothetical protein
MSNKGQIQPGANMLHSSVAAFEVRHQTAAQAAVEGGFTRRCGTRAPEDKRPCMYQYGHDGRHAWEPAQT